MLKERTGDGGDGARNEPEGGVLELSARHEKPAGKLESHDPRRIGQPASLAPEAEERPVARTAVRGGRRGQ